MERDQIISDAYYAARGAIVGTLRLAKLRDPKIKKADIERWRRANNNDEKRPTKYNTWVGKEPKEEYQADLFFPHNGPPMLMMVDTFSKRMAVEPVDEKKAKYVKQGFINAFEKMGGEPKSIYTDAEGAITSNAIKDWLTQRSITSNITLKHAPLAEAMIKFVKNRLEFAKKAQKNRRETKTRNMGTDS